VIKSWNGESGEIPRFPYHTRGGVFFIDRGIELRTRKTITSSNAAHKSLQENKNNTSNQTGVNQMEFKGSRTEKNLLAAFAGEFPGFTTTPHRNSFFSSLQSIYYAKTQS
jgi:hypothetical protein